MGAYGYIAYGLGAVTPGLREELGVSATAAGLHASAFAVGMLVAAVVTPRAAAATGRRAVAWGGAAGIALGSALIIAAPALPVTVAGALVAGTGGGITLNTVGAALASEHPRAVLEGNVVASVMGVAVPMLVAAAIAMGLGWQAGLGAGIAGIAALALVLGRAPLGAAETGVTPSGRAPLPQAFWSRWAVLLGVVAAEFAVVVWAGSFLREATDLGAAAAVAGAGLFNAGMLAGRIVGSRLELAVTDPAALLRAGVLIGLAGSLAFWLAPGAGPKLAGLLVAGLGAANTFPTGYTLAVAAAPGRADQASARVMLAGGTAILVAPIGLAALADTIGLTTALGLVPVLLLATLALARNAERRSLEPSPEPARA